MLHMADGNLAREWQLAGPPKSFKGSCHPFGFGF